MVIHIGENVIPSSDRSEKGRSLICFPDNYCVIDIETTGLSSDWDYIIEIGAIRYLNGKEDARFSSLVQPPMISNGVYIDSFISALTGISNADLEHAPKADEVLPAFSSFLADSIIVGYNVNFDINFLYDAFEAYLHSPLSNDFVDVLRLARKLHPDMPHHRLTDLVSKYNIQNLHSHRAIDDIEVTKACFDCLHDDALRQFGTESAFIDSFKRKRFGKSPSVRAADIVGDSTRNDPDSPFYNRYCVFTGKLEKYTRQEAMQIVADMGGFNEDRVTQKTSYLVLGNNDYRKSINGGKSNKHKQAESYKLKGQDIEIVPENVFYELLEEYFMNLNQSESENYISTTSIDWIDHTKRMLDELAVKLELPKHSLFLEENRSQKDLD